MNRRHFEEDTPAFAEIPIGCDDTESEEIGMRMDSQEDTDMMEESANEDEEAYMTKGMGMSADEVVETGGKKKENKATRFSAF